MLERYFVCSDIHDDVEALAQFADYAQAQDADRLLVLGDFSLRPYTSNDLAQLKKTENVPEFIQAKRKHTQNILGEMKDLLENTEIPYSVIPGNYDSNHDIEVVFGDHNLHKKDTKFGEALVYGHGGANAFPHHIGLLVQLREIEILDNQELFDSLERIRPDIALTHTPPHLLCDDQYDGQNMGTPAITQHIVNCAPRLILSGHIHEAGPLGNNPNEAHGIRAFQKPSVDEDITFVLNPGNLGRFEGVHPHTLDPIQKFDYGTFLRVDVMDDGIPTKVIMYSLQTTDRTIGEVKTLAEHSL
ncbi:hypothetical protein GOV03_00875 [Candidatus Woesearchaeota archaeon]|nr:hypothetical protein [Candidatus Woesearchaeota archaeon]